MISVIDIWISVMIIYFSTQITEKYSTAMCYCKMGRGGLGLNGVRFELGWRRFKGAAEICLTEPTLTASHPTHPPPPKKSHNPLSQPHIHPLSTHPPHQKNLPHPTSAPSLCTLMIKLWRIWVGSISIMIMIVWRGWKSQTDRSNPAEHLLGGSRSKKVLNDI